MEYFSWLPGVFVSYPMGFSRILSLCIAAAFALWLAWSLRTGRVGTGKLIVWTLVWLGFAAAGLGVGLGASFLLAKITGTPWRLTYLPGMPGDKAIPWILLAVELSLAWLLATRKRQAGAIVGAGANGEDSAFAGAAVLNFAFLALFHRYLPGGTFLFALPLAVALASSTAAKLARRPWIGLAGPAFAVSLFVPVLHLFHLALTIGTMGIVLFLAAFPMALSAPALAAMAVGGSAPGASPGR
jgi:hypothetical protein